MASCLVGLHRLAFRKFCKNTTISLLRSNRNLYTPNSKPALSVGRLSIKNQTAFYYVKPKQKKGPTVSGWLKFGVAVTAAVTGVIIYIGKEVI